DDSGGAIVVWSDYRSMTHSHLFAQHVNAAGEPRWTSNGVAVCTASGDQVNPALVSTGASGVFIVWQDHRSGSSADIYAQVVYGDGTLGGGTLGVPIES